MTQQIQYTGISRVELAKLKWEWKTETRKFQKCYRRLPHKRFTRKFWRIPR